ncbi:MAG: DUF2804 domain-containing protein [Solirubrobacterales bacterium]
MQATPQRSAGSPLRSELPRPPGPMPLVRDRRPLKAWTYAGLFSEELMLCAASVRIGPLPQCFWAVLERGTGHLADGTSFGGRAVSFTGSQGGARGLGISAGEVNAALRLEPCGEAVEVLSPHGRSYIWTLKLPVRAGGNVTVEGRHHRLEARGLMDISAGYHARSTAWKWTCGVGEDRAGNEIAWNVVAGMHDDSRGSERTLWTGELATELPGALFDEGLTEVSFPGDPAFLRFSAEAERARRDDFGLLMSDYRQPFGSFSGSLPGAELAWGLGVMERHEARW